MPNKVWSPEEKAAMIVRLKAGESFDQVGKLYDLTGVRIRQITGYRTGRRGKHQRERMLRNLERTKELHALGWSNRQIADELGVCLQTGRSYHRKLGIKLPHGGARPRKKQPEEETSDTQE